MVDSSKAFQVIAHVIMILLALFCLIPIVLLIVSSITSEKSLLTNGYSFLPSKIDFVAYKYLLLGDANKILRAYGVTLFVTVFGTTVNVIMTTLLAYPLSRKDLPGRNSLSFIIFFTMMFGGGLVPTYMMWTQVFSIKNTIWALIVPGLLLAPFNVIMMRTYFTTTVPEAIIEAARIDGASEMMVLRKVILPMSLPIMATIGLLVSLAYWNDWMNGFYYMNNDKYFSIQVLLNKMMMDVQYLQSAAAGGINVGQAATKLPSTALRMAVAVLGALPMLIVYPFFQKYFVKGISIGGVKG